MQDPISIFPTRNSKRELETQKENWEEERNEVRKNLRLGVCEKHPQLMSCSCASIKDPKEIKIMESTMPVVKRMFNGLNYDMVVQKKDLYTFSDGLKWI